jgi:hypothetical protein
MNPPKAGDLLSKQQVLDIIIANVNRAYSNKNDGYDDLCTVFEATFDYDVDMQLKYDPTQDKFLVYEVSGN